MRFVEFGSYCFADRSGFAILSNLIAPHASYLPTRRRLYELLDKVVERIKEKHNIKEDRWVSGEEAMRKLRITSRITLQKLRDEGSIRYS